MPVQTRSAAVDPLLLERWAVVIRGLARGNGLPVEVNAASGRIEVTGDGKEILSRYRAVIRFLSDLSGLPVPLRIEIFCYGLGCSPTFRLVVRPITFDGKEA